MGAKGTCICRVRSFIPRPLQQRKLPLDILPGSSVRSRSSTDILWRAVSVCQASRHCNDSSARSLYAGTMKLLPSRGARRRSHHSAIVSKAPRH
jgi:hypothetical protein